MNRGGRSSASWPNAMPKPSKSDLKRLAAVAEALYVSCHLVEYDAPSTRDPALTAGLKRVARKIGQMKRDRIEAGHLLEQAEDLVHPGFGIACGLRFLAQAEPYLDPVDVSRLQALAQSQNAHDEFRRELPEAKRVCEHDMN